jgi:hypothetical protein
LNLWLRPSTKQQSLQVNPSIMAGMENKSNESSESKGKMASKAQRFESLDGLEEYEKDDIHSLLNKLLAATDVFEVKKAKN